MSRHLRDTLAAFAAEEKDAYLAARPDAAPFTRTIAARVTRRRAARAGAAVAASAAAVVGVTAGVQAVTANRHPAPPASTDTSSATPTSTPSPSVTPSPSPTPAPEPTAAPTTAAEAVTVHPLLPPAEAMPPGAFDRTGPGWVLVQRSLVAGTGEGDGPIEMTYFYLVDPSGTRYEVPFHTDRSINLTDWLPGTTTAVVQLGGPGDWSGGIALLDLETGAFAELPDAWGHALLTAAGAVVVNQGEKVTTYDPSGDVIASTPVAGWAIGSRLDAGRSRLLVAVQDADVLVLDATTLRAVDAPGVAAHLERYTCPDGAWLDQSTVVLSCLEEGAPDTVGQWVVPLDGQARRLMTETTPVWSPVTVVAIGGVTYVAYEQPNDEGQPRAVLARLTPQGLVGIEPALFMPERTGDRLVGWPASGIGVAAVDPATGDAFEVMPVLGDRDLSPATDQVGYTTFVVAR